MIYNKQKRDEQDRLIQSGDVAEYLNGFFRPTEHIPQNNKENAVPEIYIIDHYLNIYLCWYADGRVINRTSDKKIEFNDKDVFGWCYKEELFPDLTSLHKRWEKKEDPYIEINSPDEIEITTSKDIKINVIHK